MAEWIQSSNPHSVALWKDLGDWLAFGSKSNMQTSQLESSVDEEGATRALERLMQLVLSLLPAL